jgi:aspartyl-tRNA(Asn)/glutamyl-tRNA(Gln) amidotransferase subunit A
MKLNELTAHQAYIGLRRKDYSSVELTKACLDQIRKVDKEIGAFVTVTDELALKQAKAVDEKIARGEEIKPLEGIPCAIKDNILIEGLRCTCSSKILENYIASYDAFVIKKLKEQGAVFLGKTNMDEFGMGSSTENSALKKTKNPHDLTRVPGGSSGGSAAAVASDMCIYALGSDTGGSIRQPASFCGVVGIKPTYGRVSRYGLVAMASSLDQIGPITKDCEDAALVLREISGPDTKDSTCVNFDVPDYTEAIPWGIKNLRVGVIKEYFEEGVDKEVSGLVKKAIKEIERLGAKVKEVSLSHTKYALPCYYIIMPAEVSANLARYDGIRYGYSSAKAKDLLDVYLSSRAKGLGDEVRRRIMLGTFTLSAGYYEAYYAKAQRVRTKIKREYDEVFRDFDVLIGPTTPTCAFKLGERIKDPLTMYMSDILTVPANIAGMPAISVPCGFVKRDSRKLPVGLQIIGDHFKDEMVLRVASSYELREMAE